MNNQRVVCGLIVLLGWRVCSADNGIEEGGADHRVFIKGSSVTVLLNYSQFSANQLPTINPTLTQTNLVAAIEMDIERWIRISGTNLTMTYGGTTQNVNPAPGQIIITAGTSAPALGASAMAFSAPTTDDITNGSCQIVFYREASGGGGYYNWHAFNSNDYPINATYFQGGLLHELGHCFGLAHNTDADGAATHIRSLRSIMDPGTNMHDAYGPYIEDVEDVNALYGVRPSAQFESRLSKDGAKSWSAGVSGPTLPTYQTPVANRDDDRMILFYTTRAHHPAFVVGNYLAQNWNTPVILTNEHSLFGTSGSGGSGEYMMAWVDPEDQNRVKVVYTDDAGAHWQHRDPGANFRAAGTPSIRKVEPNTWMLSFVYVDQSSQALANGVLYSVIATDDGSTWGTPAVLNVNSRSLGGVSVTSRGRSDIRIAFVEINDANPTYSMAINTVYGYIDGNNSLVANGSSATYSLSAVSEVSLTASSLVYAMGFRRLDPMVETCNSNFGANAWGNCAPQMIPNFGMPPALAANPNADWIYMFKAK